MRRRLRLLGTFLVAAGVLALVWTVVVWRWQDPFTALYTHWEQGKLSRSLERQFESYRAPRIPQSLAVAGEERVVARAALAYRRAARRGQAIGRIVVPRLGLDMAVVNGTDHDSLTKGPGHYLGSAMPGENRLVYIAGHRTTYLAPFSAIDHMRKGDRVTIRMPYATFVYAVTGHRIVRSDDLAVLRSPHHELLELQACHPRFFATHRYIVYALPVRVAPARGRPYDPRRAVAEAAADGASG
jgi:sortase A